MTLENTFSLDPQSKELHKYAVEASLIFRKAEVTLVDRIIEVARKNVYVKVGYSSLYLYSLEALCLSEGVSYYVSSVAKKCLELPRLQEEMRAGKITLSKAKKIISVITPENQEIWLERAATLKSRDLEHEVAKASPRASVRERAKYTGANRMELTLGVSEEMMIGFRTAQEIVCRSKGRPASLEETLAELLGDFLKRKDPKQKAKRVIAKKGFGAAKVKRKSPKKAEKVSPQPANESPATQVNLDLQYKVQATGKPAERKTDPKKDSLFLGTKNSRKPLPAHIEHAIQLRDQGRCQYRKLDGGICGETRFIHLHHILPLSQGGPDTVENLVTLCSLHHSEVHRQLDAKTEDELREVHQTM